MPKAVKKITKKKTASVAPVVAKPLPFYRTLPQIGLSRKKLMYVAIVIAVGVIAYLGKGLIWVATVNGEMIPRLEVIKNLEGQYGTQETNSLITKALILQEAKKEKVTITDAEINAEIKKIETSVTSQGQNLDELLKSKNMTRDKLKEQIKMNVLIEKLLGKTIVISDAQVAEYFEANKASFPPDAKLEDLKPAIKEQLQQQALSAKFQTWLEALRQKAKINYLVNY